MVNLLLLSAAAIAAITSPSRVFFVSFIQSSFQLVAPVEADSGPLQSRSECSSESPEGLGKNNNNPLTVSSKECNLIKLEHDLNMQQQNIETEPRIFYEERRLPPEERDMTVVSASNNHLADTTTADDLELSKKELKSESPQGMTTSYHEFVPTVANCGFSQSDQTLPQMRNETPAGDDNADSDEKIQNNNLREKLLSDSNGNTSLSDDPPPVDVSLNVDVHTNIFSTNVDPDADVSLRQLQPKHKKKNSSNDNDENGNKTNKNKKKNAVVVESNATVVTWQGDILSRFSDIPNALPNNGVPPLTFALPKTDQKKEDRWLRQQEKKNARNERVISQKPKTSGSVEEENQTELIKMTQDRGAGETT